MKKLLFILLLSPILCMSQSEDSIPKRTKQEHIRHILDDRGFSAAIGVIKMVQGEDTLYGLISGVSCYLLMKSTTDSLRADSLAGKALQWDQYVVVNDEIRKQFEITAISDSTDLIAELQRFSTQEILDKYIHKDYVYVERSVQLGYCLLITLYMRNIVMCIDDESGYLMIDRRVSVIYED